MRIIVFSNIPSPYFVEYLNELGKKADITAYFERERASDRDASWNHSNKLNFRFNILGGFKFGPESTLSAKVIGVLSARKENEIVLFANPMTPTGIIGILYCQYKGIPYALQSEGGFVKNGKGPKEKLKKRIVSNASLCLSGMKSNNDYFIGYGARPDTVYNYPFASLHSRDIPIGVISAEEKNKIKNELSINDNPIVLYVGRMLYIKGVDVLVKAVKEINRDALVLMVGGLPTPELKSIIENEKINNIRFINHVQLEELVKYYYAADVFVLPTRSDTWGLVINEAMTYGLPIVTTDMCVAGLELIENGINGYVVTSEDEYAMAEKINYLLSDSDLRVMMAEKNNQKMQSFSYENMANVIYQAIDDNKEMLCKKRIGIE